MSQGKVAVFDIETIPDADLLRLHFGESNVEDEAIIARAREEAVERNGSDFLSIVFHKVVAISVLERTDSTTMRISSKHLPEHDEQASITAFFRMIDRTTPQLVSWNGGGFDLPVLHLRALRYRIDCAGYWQGPPGNRYEQYTKRYSDCHLDVMDRLASYSPRCFTSLENAALSCGLPGKMGFSGADVYDQWRKGEYQQIADYCETDVLNTYLLWLRFMLIAGHLTTRQHDDECEALANMLASSQKKHLMDFHASWITSNPSSS